MATTGSIPANDEYLELHAEPELHRAILVELTPDVEDAKNHRLEEEVYVCSQADHLKTAKICGLNLQKTGTTYGAAYPVEDQEEQIVSWSAVEIA